MKSLFVCTTPFQVMNCISIANNISGSSVLVVLNKFPGYIELCNNIKKCNLFFDVIPFDDSQIWASNSKNWLRQRLSTIRTYSKCKPLIEKFFPDISTYTDIYISSRAQVNRLLCMYVAQWIENCRIHFFDDGLGSYSGSIIKIKRIDYILRRLLVGKKAVSFKYDLYLYSPELYYEYNDRNIEVNKIQISDSDKIIISQVFEYNNAFSLDFRNILFDTIPSVEFTMDGEKTYKDFLTKLIVNGNVIIKQHPRNTEKIPNALYFPNPSVPFEVVCSKSDFSKYTFITSCSTAVFTPKLLFDQEPKIVFLYKALDKYRKNKKHDCDRLVNSLRKMYRNPERIVVANYLEDVESFL